MDESITVATHYYPSSDGAITGEYNNFSFTVVMGSNGTFTVEATNDDAASPDWFDVTTLGLLLSTGDPGAASITNTSDGLVFRQFNFQKWRVKVVQITGAQNGQVHVRRRYN